MEFINSTGTFPDACKMEKLKPIFRKCFEEDPKNYRSFFFLTFMSEVLERSIHEQTTKCLGKHKILYISISTLKKSSRKPYLTDEISNGFDFHFVRVMISIGLKKAFGTTQHNVLLQKVPAFKFSNEVTNWFRLHLSSKKFQRNVHDKFSTSANLRWVLHVSILGIFIIFSTYKKNLTGLRMWSISLPRWYIDMKT